MEPPQKQILKALLYIEKHLDEKLQVSKLAKVACYSPFHFQRLFHEMMNESVYQYIKRVKLQRAAGKLAYSKASVTRIAFDIGFESHSSFTHAFRKFSGAAPKDYRSLFSPSLLTKEEIQELKMIHPETVKNIQDIHIYFVRSQGNYTESGKIAWSKLNQYVSKHQIQSQNLRCIGISHDNPRITEEEHLRYDACLEANANTPKDPSLGETTIKGGRYAIFRYTGPYSGLAQTFSEIYLKWLPESCEQCHPEKPPFCEYLDLKSVLEFKNSSTPVTLIHIPLK